jgi:WhiB family transcriptional regulator, redox-sensing transcriptional regulator
MFFDFVAEAELAYRAKEVCDVCPVRMCCLTFAIKNNETEGIWGGLTPGERKRWKWFNRIT